MTDNPRLTRRRSFPRGLGRPPAPESRKHTRREISGKPDRNRPGDTIEASPTRGRVIYSDMSRSKHRGGTRRRGNQLVRVVPQGPVGAPDVQADPIQISMADRTIKVNIGLLPPPQRSYDADVAFVKRQHGYVAFYFGQLNEGRADNLRSRVKLKYTNEMFVHHYWKHSRDFHEDLRTQIVRWKDDPLRLPAMDLSAMPAGMEHSEWVNFDYISRSNSQASFDFYHLPPSALAKFVKGQGSNELNLAPVLRVLTTVHVLLDLMNACEPIVDEVRPLLPLFEDLEIGEEEAAHNA